MDRTKAKERQKESDNQQSGERNQEERKERTRKREPGNKSDYKPPGKCSTIRLGGEESGGPG